MALATISNQITASRAIRSQMRLRYVQPETESTSTIPAKGVVHIRDFLVAMGVVIGVKRIRRLMRKMAIEPFYPKPNLSKLGKAKYVCPYLLRCMTLDLWNQVWSTDITYIPMPRGFLYLYAIIDVYSRNIVGWNLYSTLEADIPSKC